MKKHLYKILAGLLVGTSMISMTACSSSQGGNATIQGAGQKEEKKDVPMGRYVEEKIEIPSEVTYIMKWKILEDGAIRIYGQTKEQKIVSYDFTQEGEWKKQEISWASKLGEYEKAVAQIDEDVKGQIYVMYSDKEYNMHVVRISLEGEMKEIAIEWGETYGYPMQMEVLPSGDILIGRQSIGVTRFSGEDGRKLTQYDGIEGTFSIKGNKLYQMDMEQGGISVVDIETGSEIEFIPSEGIDWGNKMLVGEDESIYIINERGISRLASGGSLWENIIEAATSSFGAPALFVRDVMMKDSEEFLTLFSSQEGGHELIRYTYNPDVPSRPTTEINIYMLEANTTMKQAIAEYQRINPDVFINVQVGLDSEGSMTKSDAIRKLNTELLAGKGPDLIILDGLPIQSYIDKGVLMNMGDWTNTKIKQGEWLDNIAKAYEEDGKIYALPTKFQLPTMWGNKDIVGRVDGLDNIAKWAEANPDKQVLYNMTPGELIKRVYGVTAHEWLDEKGQIKEEEFAQFLETIKVLSDEEAEEKIEEDERFKTLKSAEYLAYKDIELHLETVKGFLDISMAYSAMVQNGESVFGLMASNEEKSFKPVGIIGINANTEYPEIAKEIVELSLSPRVQDISFLDGFPVNKASFEKQRTEDSGIMMAMSVMHGRPIEWVSPTQEVIDQLAEYAKMTTIPTFSDEVLLQMILEETKGYFNGEKTANEAAAAVAQRTRAYLAE